MKPLYIFVLALCTVSIIYIYTTYTPTPKDNTFLTIGITAGYAPYISINEQGAYEGFDIDVAYALAKQLNKKLVLKDLGSMAPLMIALEQDSVDMIIWGLTITPSRLNKLAMIHYQGENSTTNPLVFWQRIPDGVTTLDDMQGATICVEPASFQADIIAAYPHINILPTEKVDDALLNIQYGKADAALLDPEIAKKFKAAYDEIKIIDIQLPQQVQALGIGIGIKKDNRVMIDAVASAIAQLKNDGTIKTLEARWNV